MSTDDSQRNPVEKLAEQFFERRRRGDRVSVEEYTRNHPELAAQLQRVLPLLMVLEDEAGSPGAAGGTADNTVGWTPPERLDEFRLLGEIGRGGMGIVYAAWQESLGRRVALKVLPFHAVLSPRELARFGREAQAAARLHHSNIVPVFCVGEDQGIHYYAMQYIAGPGLDRVVQAVCRQQSASRASVQGDASLARPTARSSALPEPREDSFGSTRNDLEAARTPHDGDGKVPPRSVATGASGGFAATQGREYYRQAARIALQVAEALAYAHEQGVLHRDIKPSNILLDGDGHAWVADFGLTKGNGHEDLTRTGEMAGTLRYMAPERLRGWSDPRSDVYGLGLTLYEMLGLRPAFEGADHARLMEQITRQEPVRPGKYRRDVPRDLETIVLKAIAKEPENRYQSASELASDLRRYVDGRPILARRIALSDRAWLWARRNPALAAVGALAAALLVVVAAVTTVGYLRTTAALAREHTALAEVSRQREKAFEQRDRAEIERARAEENFNRARQAVDRYLTMVSEDVLLETPSMRPLRVELLSAAMEYYEEFAAQYDHDPTMKAELVVAYFRLAHVASQIGREWIDPFQRGVELAVELVQQSSNPADFRSWQEGIYKSRWVDAPDDHPEEALGLLHRAAPVWQQLAKGQPDVPAFRADLAGLYAMISWFEHLNGNSTRSLSAAGQSREILENLISEFPKIHRYRYDLAILERTLGEHFVHAKLYTKAERHLSDAIEKLKTLNAERPDSAEYRAAHGRALLLMGTAYLGQKRTQEAGQAYGGAARLFAPLVNQYPLVDRFFEDYEMAMRQQSRLLADDDTGYKATAALYREFVKINRARFGDGSDEVAAAMIRLSQFLFNFQGEYDEALSLARESLELCERAFGASHATTGEAQHRLARMLAQRPGASPDDADEALRLAKLATANLPADALAFQTLGIALYRCGDYGASMEALVKADQLAGKRSTTCQYYRAMLDWILGNVGRALRQWRRGEAWVTAHPEQLPYYRLARSEARTLIAPRLAGIDNDVFGETEALYRAHIASIRRRFGGDNENTAKVLILLAQLLFAHRAEYDEALSLMREALAIRERTFGDSHASTAEARQKLSRMLSDWPAAKQTDSQEALRLAEMATAAVPDDYPAHMALGMALYRCGQYEASVDAIGRAHELAGHGLTVCRYYLAMNYWKLGDAKMAQEQWEWGENYVEAYPESLPYCRLPRDDARTLLAPVFESK